MIFTFTVFGEAQQWRVKQSRNFRTYADPKMTKWQDSVRFQAIAAMGGAKLWDGAIRLDMKFYKPYPKSYSKKKRERTPYLIFKPDATNLGKCLEDALRGIVMQDDCQTVDIRARKFWGAPPRVEIEVEQL